MRFLCFASVFFATLFNSSHGESAVIERDFLTPGDGLLTYDDVNQREWLDLTFTSGVHIAITSLLTHPNDSFEEFRFATLGDVESLAESAGVIWIGREDSQPTPETFQNALDLHFLLGNVFTLQTEYENVTIPDVGFFATRTSFGQIATLDPTTNRVFDGSVVSLVVLDGSEPGSVRLANNGNARYGGLTTELPFPTLPLAAGDVGPFWLYRQVVPEPISMIHVALALFVGVAIGRQRRLVAS